MPRYARLASVLPFLLLLLLLMPASLAARDEVSYGRYLGVRLRMYEESYAVLDRVIASAKGDAQARAKQVKAEVIKSEADNKFAEDGDVQARIDRYKAAIEVFGSPTEPAGALAKGRLLLDVAADLRRLEPGLARDYCDQAATLLDEPRKALEAERDRVRQEIFAPKAEVFNAIYFHYCRSFYVKSLTFDAGSEEREQQLRLAEKWIDEFDFMREGVTREFVLTYELRGEIALARENVEEAVTKFLDLVSFLGQAIPNAEVGTIALQHGYLRAAELLTTELDYDPARLQRAIDLYSEAFSRYGSLPELDFWFKRFQLFQISALIKQGKADNVRGAVDLLFRLAADRDPTFRRNALTVLADVASRPELSDEMRFRCAETVFADLATNSVNVILKNIQAYQTLLVNCTDVQKFETYAPACFARITEMYGAMWRFMEAAQTAREATYRAGYFRDKFSDAEEVPAHMRGRLPMIKDVASLTGFPGEMASQAARYAGFLIKPDIGDPNNRDLVNFNDEMVRLKAAWGGEGALMDLAFRQANEHYKQNRFAQAAAKHLNLPATYRNYHIAVYAAAKAYYRLTDDPRAQRISSFGESDEQESLQFFEAQEARHATDLAGLPEALWKGIDAEHWPVIKESRTSAALANWHKSVYFNKKYFLLEAQRNWANIKDALAEKESPTLADAIVAVAEARNQAWLAANPTERGDPDIDMTRMGRAAFDLAYLLRNPPGDPESAAALRAKGRELALRILRPFWAMYGYHIADTAAYNRASQSMAFSALIEADDPDAAEQVYLRYAEAFPDNTDEIRSMVRRLLRALSEKYQPRAQALLNLSLAFSSRSAVLKKNQFERINGQTFPEDAKKLEEAKTAAERRKVLADHFWRVWMVEYTFNSSGRAAIEDYMSSIEAEIEQRWKTMSEEYPRRWAQAVRAELDALLARDNFAPVKAAATKAAEGDPQALLDRLEEAAGKASGREQQLLQQMVSTIRLNTDELQFFTGAVFIYEFGDYLEALSGRATDRARPIFARILKYFEEDRTAGQGGSLASMSTETVRRNGGYYFMIGDWSNTVRYLEDFAERSRVEWGKVEVIPVNVNSRVIGRIANAEELAVRYMLGKSYMEMHKESGDRDQLAKAALHLRRCMLFNQIRDTNKKLGDIYKLGPPVDDVPESLRPAIELYYVAGAEAMAETFELMHKQEDMKVEWPAYVSQVTNNLTEKKDEKGAVVLQEVPRDKPGYLWHASQARLQLWASFTELSAFQYRGEFRTNLVEWLELTIQWVDEYGVETLPAGVDRATIETRIREAIVVAKREGSFNAAYMTDDTRKHVETVKSLAEKLEASAAKAGIR